MATRVLALLVAVGMVAGALAVRSALDRDANPGGGGDDDFVLVCARELGDLCDELDAAAEPANATAERLIALAQDADPGIDAWLVPGPWPQMVDDVRALDRKPPIFEENETLGRSPLVVVTRGGVDAACAAEWTCVADGAVDGSHDVGAPPTTDAIGVLARAAALSARVGHTDYSGEVFVDESGWLAELTTALDRNDVGAGTLGEFLVKRGSADGFITTEAIASVLVPSGFDTARPEPAAHVALTLGLRAGASKPGGINETAGEHGWPPPQTPAGDNGLPSPDVLYALREFL